MPVNVQGMWQRLKAASDKSKSPEKKAASAGKALGGYSGQAAKAITARKKAMAKALKDTK
jgi:hypothetical protein